MPYFDPKTNGFNFAGFISALEDAPNGTAVLLHACAHNPTGVDPTFEQWKKIADVFERKGHLAFFDMAYQGFASGSLEKDAQAVKLWQQRNLPFMLAQSFAKSMGLYGLRTGAFSVTCENPKDARLVSEQAGFYARQTWSSPPLYGSTIAKTLIGNPQFYDLWKKDLLTMSGRIAEMRTALRQGLTAQGNNFYLIYPYS
jgi:aspartate/tyrosine/aromatic aminotransferase